MESSTSRRGSFDRRRLAWLCLGIAGAPLLWLATIQTGYTLAYEACDTRSKRWVTVPTFTAVAVILVVTVVCARASRQARDDRAPVPLIGRLAVGLAALMATALIASAIGPLV